MSALLDKFAEQKAFAIQSGIPLKEFQITEAESAELLRLNIVYFEQGPRPPVNRISKIIREAGLFTKEIRFEHIEYDNHAPAYLAALKKWEARPSKTPLLYGLPFSIINKETS